MQRLSLGFDQFIAALRREGFACRRSPDVQGASLTHSRVIITASKRGEGRVRQEWVPTRYWASRDVLFNFTLRKYRAETSHGDEPFQPDDGRAEPLTLGRWLPQLGLHSLSKDGGALAAEAEVLPVCYGGEFGATRENIRRVAQADWRILAAALDRGDNIIEGHLIERAWAALIGPRFPPTLVRRMLCRCGDDTSRREVLRPPSVYAGLLIDPPDRPSDAYLASLAELQRRRHRRHRALMRDATLILTDRSFGMHLHSKRAFAGGANFR